MRPTHAWEPCLMSQIWRWSIKLICNESWTYMCPHIYNMYGIYVIAALVKWIQYSLVPRLQLFIISSTLTENLGRDLGAKLLLLHIHALSNLQKCTLPTILSVYFLNFLQLHHRLKPGEAMTFNNRRFIHSRTAFKLNGGMRHLQVLLMLVITVECIMCLLHTVILTNCLHTLLCISVVMGLCFRFWFYNYFHYSHGFLTL